MFRRPIKKSGLSFQIIPELHQLYYQSTKTMSLTNIFVYGTLKTGQPNHYFISQAAEDGHEATLIGHAKTVQRYPLVVAGCVNCPYLLDAPGKGKVGVFSLLRHVGLAMSPSKLYALTLIGL